MSIIFSDDFNRASLGTTNWSDEGGVWSISGSTILAVSSANFRVLNTTTTAHAAIADCRVKFTRASATFDGAMVVRSNVSGATSASGNCYVLNPFGTQFDVIRRIAGVNTTLSGGLTGLTSANGDVWEVLVQGTGATVTFDIYQNTNLRGQITDSGATRILVAGQTGFVTFSASSRFDDFSVDDLAGGGATIYTRRPMDSPIFNSRILQ